MKTGEIWKTSKKRGAAHFAINYPEIEILSFNENAVWFGTYHGKYGWCDTALPLNAFLAMYEKDYQKSSLREIPAATQGSYPPFANGER